MIDKAINTMLEDIKDEVVTALAINFIQNGITGDDIAGKVVEIITGMKYEPVAQNKVDFKDVPIRWHGVTGRKGKKIGNQVVISDGVDKEGFLSHSECDRFLKQPIGYTSSRIKNGEKIFKLPEWKEYFVLHE